MPRKKKTELEAAEAAPITTVAAPEPAKPDSEKENQQEESSPGP